MHLINIENVSITFSSRKILDEVNFGIDSEDKIGIVGINGTGKSTLLSIAAGVLEPDEGTVVRGREVRISYLQQNPSFEHAATIGQWVEERISGTEQHWNISGEVRARLADFGILDPDAPPDQLSGGQRKRAALIAALLTPCDLLILDEPTNHLDSRMIEWLEDYLNRFNGALLMITHDRYFLDRVTNQIVEIDRGKAYRYQDNYSGYLEMKQQRMEYAAAAERNMAALYRQDLAWMMRGARARSTKQKAHIQRFEQLKNRERIMEERRMQLDALPGRMGNKTIELENVGKSYEGTVLFRDFTYRFLKNDRIGIVGPNGCGKTTLIRCITGDEAPDTGSIEIGQTIKIGWFRQEETRFDEKQTVLSYIRDTAEYIHTSEGLTSASAMCDRFLFPPEMQHTIIGKLSGGERRRLSLLKVLMEAPNVLVLDEPTNDLDIQTLRILEDFLDRFSGIVLTVSHDRYFLDRVVTRIFAFQEDGTLWQSEGGYTEYREHCLQAGKEVLFAQGRDRKNAGEEKKVKPSAGSERESRPVKKRLSYREQKEYDTIEDEISHLEEESAQLEEEMALKASDYAALTELSARKEEVDAQLDAKLERYIELQELVESLQNKS